MMSDFDDAYFERDGHRQRGIGDVRVEPGVAGAFHIAITPANAKSCSSGRWKKCGRLALTISPVAGSVRSTCFHSYQPAAGIRQRDFANAPFHIGFVAASSQRALWEVRGGFGSFHQFGTNPQRALTSAIFPVARSSRRIGIVDVGVTL